mmetsp:Transcript_4065/g.11607  ORF Transcript_4065/g.11607 Transcript_4065/m.11607 type:complete len:326 (-) Transcript_4065:765-1742(-)
MLVAECHVRDSASAPPSAPSPSSTSSQSSASSVRELLAGNTGRRSYSTVAGAPPLALASPSSPAAEPAPPAPPRLQSLSTPAAAGSASGVLPRDSAGSCSGDAQSGASEPALCAPVAHEASRDARIASYPPARSISSYSAAVGKAPAPSVTGRLRPQPSDAAPVAPHRGAAAATSTVARPGSAWASPPPPRASGLGCGGAPSLRGLTLNSKLLLRSSLTSWLIRGRPDLTSAPPSLPYMSRRDGAGCSGARAAAARCDAATLVKPPPEPTVCNVVPRQAVGATPVVMVFDAPPPSEPAPSPVSGDCCCCGGGGSTCGGRKPDLPG